MIGTIRNRLEQRFGETCPAPVEERLKYECGRMQALSMERYIQVLYEVTQSLREKRIPYSMDGQEANSFLLSLLEITAVDPLPPHYYCPNCHRIEFPEFSGDGFDLPAKTCACGTPFRTDGHGLDPVLFWGPSSADSTMQPSLTIKVPERLLDEVKGFFARHPLLRPDDKIERLGGLFSTFGPIHLSGTMGYPSDDSMWYTPADIPAVRTYFLENYESFLGIDPKTRVVPKTFRGVLRLYGLTRGEWSGVTNSRTVRGEDGAEKTVCSVDDFASSLSEVPAFTDDAYRMLRSHDLSEEEAYREIGRIQYGRGLSEEIRNRCAGDRSAEWCNAAIRMISKSRALQSMVLTYRLQRSNNA